MMVKRLTTDSFPMTISWLADKCATSVTSYAPFNARAFVAGWQGLLLSNMGFAFGLFDHSEYPVGAICGLVMTDPYTGITQGSEHLWIVCPDCRRGGGALKLLEAFEAESRARGAKILVCGCPHENVAAMGRLYARRGYEPHVDAFRKWI